MSVVSTVLNNAEAQEKHWALVDCFATWDNSGMSIDVLVDGLYARYRAMGRPLEGVRFHRQDLRTVEIDCQYKDGQAVGLFTVKRYSSEPVSPAVKFQDGDSWIAVYPVNPEYFHRHELEALGKFVIDNVYHK